MEDFKDAQVRQTLTDFSGQFLTMWSQNPSESSEELVKNESACAHLSSVASESLGGIGSVLIKPLADPYV